MSFQQSRGQGKVSGEPTYRQLLSLAGLLVLYHRTPPGKQVNWNGDELTDWQRLMIHDFALKAGEAFERDKISWYVQFVGDDPRINVADIERRTICLTASLVATLYGFKFSNADTGEFVSNYLLSNPDKTIMRLIVQKMPDNLTTEVVVKATETLAIELAKLAGKQLRPWYLHPAIQFWRWRIGSPYLARVMKELAEEGGSGPYPDPQENHQWRTLLKYRHDLRFTEAQIDAACSHCMFKGAYPKDFPETLNAAVTNFRVAVADGSRLLLSEVATGRNYNDTIGWFWQVSWSKDNSTGSIVLACGWEPSRIQAAEQAGSALDALTLRYQPQSNIKLELERWAEAFQTAKERADHDNLRVFSFCWKLPNDNFGWNVFQRDASKAVQYRCVAWGTVPDHFEGSRLTAAVIRHSVFRYLADRQFYSIASLGKLSGAERMAAKNRRYAEAFGAKPETLGTMMAEQSDFRTTVLAGDRSQPNKNGDVLAPAGQAAQSNEREQCDKVILPSPVYDPRESERPKDAVIAGQGSSIVSFVWEQHGQWFWELIRLPRENQPNELLLAYGGCAEQIECAPAVDYMLQNFRKMNPAPTGSPHASAAAMNFLAQSESAARTKMAWLEKVQTLKPGRLVPPRACPDETCKNVHGWRVPDNAERRGVGTGYQGLVWPVTSPKGYRWLVRSVEFGDVSQLRGECESFADANRMEALARKLLADDDNRRYAERLSKAALGSEPQDVLGESVATGNGSQITFVHQLGYPPIEADTLMFPGLEVEKLDLNQTTGEFTVRFKEAPPAGQEITCSYRYVPLFLRDAAADQAPEHPDDCMELGLGFYTLYWWAYGSGWKWEVIQRSNPTKVLDGGFDEHESHIRDMAEDAIRKHREKQSTGLMPTNDPPQPPEGADFCEYPEGVVSYTWHTGNPGSWAFLVGFAPTALGDKAVSLSKQWISESQLQEIELHRKVPAKVKFLQQSVVADRELHARVSGEPATAENVQESIESLDVARVGEREADLEAQQATKTNEPKADDA